MIRPTPHVAAMSPYALAELNAPAGKRVISLSQNESLRRPSPQVSDVLVSAMTNAHLYPIRNGLSCATHWPRCMASSLRHSLRQRPMELIACLTLTYCDEKSAVLAPAHAYPFFRTAAGLARARYDTAPEVGVTASVDTLLAAVQPSTRIV